MTDENRVWKVLAFVLLVSSIIAMFGWATLSTSYLNSLSRSPNVAEGRIYPFNYHGFVFYQTQAEKICLDAFVYAAIFLAAAAGLSIVGFNPQDDKTTRFHFRQ